MNRLYKNRRSKILESYVALNAFKYCPLYKRIRIVVINILYFVFIIFNLISYVMLEILLVNSFKFVLTLKALKHNTKI